MTRQRSIVVTLAVAACCVPASSLMAQRTPLLTPEPPAFFECTKESNLELYKTHPQWFRPGGATVPYIEEDAMPLRAVLKTGPMTYETRYWVRQGDIITLFGTFYCVSKISTEPRNVQCTRLSKDEIPEGLTVEADSIILPWQADTTIR